MPKSLCRLTLASVAMATALPAHANDKSELAKGFDGALRGCEEWILNPASWVEGLQPFIATVGLGSQMGRVSSVAPANLPAREFQRGNQYWRINSTQSAGYVLVVSDQLPMCHITGGGNADLQPIVTETLASADFSERWQLVSQSDRGDMQSSLYRNTNEPSLTMVVSHAKEAGGPTDRVQVIATAHIQMTH